MPSIEQLDWSKLKPAKPVKKYKKIKAIDKSIWSDNYRNMEHLSSIMRET